MERITLAAAQQAEDWHSTCATAFEDKTKLRYFPEPPRASKPCGKPGCKASAKERALKACPCDIRKLFEEDKSTLKSARVTFHPDKFSRVPEDVREKVKKAANEVFVVVDGMYKS